MDKKEALYWMEEYESYWNDACCELQELRKLIDFEYTWKDKKLTVIEKGYFGAGNDTDKTAEPDGTIDYELTKTGTRHILEENKGTGAFIPSMTQADIKRNKKVDVPTESWQKAVDRRLDSHALALEKLINK